MKWNLDDRFAAPIASVILAAVMLPTLPGYAQTPRGESLSGADTPQTLVAKYRDAFASKDWRTCFLCYDSKMRENFLSHLCYGIAVSKDAELSAICERHMSKKPADADGPASATAADRSTENLSLYEHLRRQVDDLPAFVDEVCRRFDTLGEQACRRVGDVGEIKIDKDRAVGYWHCPPDKQTGLPLAGTELSIDCCKIGGRWYMTLSELVPLSVEARTRQLEAEGGSFWMEVGCDGQNEPVEKYGELRLSVQPMVYHSTHPVYIAHLTETQTKKLIAYLATEGFVKNAIELGKQEIPQREARSKKCYIIRVHTVRLVLHEDLGWGPKMLARLDGLRGVLDGEAAQAMDAVLAGLADERAKWAAAAPGP